MQSKAHLPVTKLRPLLWVSLTLATMAAFIVALVLLSPQRGGTIPSWADDVDKNPQEAHLPAELLEQSTQRQKELKASVARFFAAEQSQYGDVEVSRNAIKLGFRKLLDHADYFDRDGSEATIFAALRQSKNVQQEIVRALTERNYAQEVYSDQQDMVRYYGIRYLADLADRGETEPLETALVQLSKTLIQEKHWMKGQWNDLEDLLKASVSRSHFKDGW